MGVVSTNERDCRDCYRCVRTCPVKAVQVKEGRARVMDERCVMDGRCIKACPQRGESRGARPGAGAGVSPRR